MFMNLASMTAHNIAFLEIIAQLSLVPKLKSWHKEETINLKYPPTQKFRILNIK